MTGNNAIDTRAPAQIEKKKKYEKAEDFIGKTFNNDKLMVVEVYQKGKHTTFKVTCTECSKDKELFPDGYFITTKSNLVKGSKPCGCSKKAQWLDWQYLILARRIGEKKGFIVHGFAGPFKNVYTKLNLECLKDGHRWTASIHSVINNGSSCPKCSGNLELTEQEALQKCVDICKEMNYDMVGFGDGYKGAYKTTLNYNCKVHGKQTVTYKNFVYNATRCKGCWKDRKKELGNFYGYYPERKDEIDFLYILNFNNKFVKVGRSFDVAERIIGLKSLSKIKSIHKLRIFTATHQEIYDFEQELHNELRERNFQHYVDWSTECFENDSLYILNKILDECGLEEVSL